MGEQKSSDPAFSPGHERQWIQIPLMLFPSFPLTRLGATSWKRAIFVRVTPLNNSNPPYFCVQVQPNDLVRVSPLWCGWETPGWVVPSWFHPPLSCWSHHRMQKRHNGMCWEGRWCLSPQGPGEQRVSADRLWAAAGIPRKNCLKSTSCAMKWSR